MAYQWCAVISEVAQGSPPYLRFDGLFLNPRESGFFDVGPGCDYFRLGEAPRHSTRPLRRRARQGYVDCLFLTTAIAFRQVDPESHQLTSSLDHTPHHNWVFDVAFSNQYDEIVADAVSAWIVDSANPPPGSFLRRFLTRVENPEEFSPRLRRATLRVLECIWKSELDASWFGIVRLLNRLEVGVDDILVEDTWTRLLESVICSPAGPEGLSSHYWSLLDKLVGHAWGPSYSSTPRYLEVMRLLEEAESWDNLEVWIKIMWRGLEIVEDVERVTLKLLSHRLSALPRFRDLSWSHRNRLQRICDQAEQLPSEIPP